jgi:hypothetical protein
MRVFAAMADSVTNSALKACYAVMLAVVNDSKMSPALRKTLNGAKPEAKQFASRFGLPSLVTLLNTATSNGVIDEDSLVSLGQELKVAIPAMTKEFDIPRASLNMFRRFGAWYRVRAEKAYSALAKQVSVLGDTTLNSAFLNDTVPQKPTKKALELLVKKIAKRNDSKLTVEEAKALKAKNLGLYKEYLRLRQLMAASWKQELANLVRQSGKRFLPMASVEKYLKSKGLEHTMPSGFTGYVDDQGKWYTTAGKLILNVPNGAFFPTVRMNPQYDPKADDGYVFQSYKEDGSPGNHIYTVDYRQQKDEHKFLNVEELKTKIKKIRAKWIPMYKSGVTTVSGVVASMLEISLIYSARIGTPGASTDGKATQGLSTLQVKNVYVQSNKDVVLRYKGKDGINHQHRILAGDPNLKYIAANIIALIAGKKPSDWLWTIPKKSGGFTRVGAGAVNKMFRALGAGNEVSVHKLRTLRGTVTFKKLMDMNEEKFFNPKKPLTEKQANLNFDWLCKQVGSILGHIRTKDGVQEATGNTAKKSYIDPAVQVEYWKKCNMRPPSYLEAWMKKSGKDT